MVLQVDSSGLAPPRPAHTLDEVALLAFVRAHVPGQAAATGVCVSQFTHGQSNPTYLLVLQPSETHVVLRKQPPGTLLASAHDVAREQRVLAALSAAGYPVPRPLALCTRQDVLGTPFYIMSYAAGTVHTRPSLPALSPSARRAAYASAVAALAALHSLDPAAIGLQVQ
jgi:acyl-CoA dehydrogenase